MVNSVPGAVFTIESLNRLCSWKVVSGVPGEGGACTRHCSLKMVQYVPGKGVTIYSCNIIRVGYKECGDIR